MRENIMKCTVFIICNAHKNMPGEFHMMNEHREEEDTLQLDVISCNNTNSHIYVNYTGIMSRVVALLFLLIWHTE